MLLKAQAIVSFFTCTCMLGATTLPAGSIGTATTNGEMQIDGSKIRSNSTLFSGSVVQTSATPSNLRLADGSQVVLNPASRMTLHRDYVVLNQGQTMQRNAGKHALIANGLKVSSEALNGVVLVGIQDPTHMEVSARTGTADVRTPTGELVARVEPGRKLSFDTTPQENASRSSVRLTGLLRPVGNHFVLTDAQSGLTFQLQGSNLAAYKGTPVQVIGMLASAEPAVAGASHLVDVSQATPQTDANSNANDTGNASGAAAVSPVTSPVFNTSSDIFLVAIAAVGILGGLAATGAFSSNTAPLSPSRP